MRISNYMPGMETCETCDKYEMFADPTTQETEAYNLHKTKAEGAKEKYDRDMATTFPAGVA